MRTEKMSMLSSLTLITTLFASNWTLAATPSDNFSDDWGDEEQAQPSSPWSYSGFVEGAYGRFLQSNIVDSNASLSEIRTRLEVSYSHPLFEFKAQGDLLYDDVLATTTWHTRTLSVATSPFDNLDIKLGRQVLTWGTGDYLFLNDLFAKDWQAFFSGRDDEYLKAPSDSVRLTYYVAGISFDLAWTPDFTPDNYLTGERFSFYSPLAQQQVAPAAQFKVYQTSQDQWSMRVATNKAGVEYALYGYHGFWGTPQGSDSQGIAFFPQLNSWGASIRLPLASGLFNAEFANYNSSQDNQGDNPAIANSQQRLLLGYEQEAAKNLTVGLQYYVEKTADYNNFVKTSAHPDQLVDQYRQLLTLRLRYTTMLQKLTYSLFVFYSPTDQDSYLRPSLDYRHDDHWSLATGANLFNGSHPYSFFGQHQDNSNAWVRVRYQF